MTGYTMRLGGRARRPGSLLTLAACAVIMVLALAALDVAPVRAQAVQTSNATVASKDPTAITFAIRVTAPGGLRSARLEYQVRNPDGSVGGGGNVEPGAGNEQDLSFTLTTRDAQRYIPVGSRFTFHWSLVANDGTTVQTPDEEYLFLDGRYDWRSQSDGPVTVYWYGTNDVSATAALQAARSSLQDTGDLLESTVPYETRVLVWRSEDEGKLAMRQQSATFDAQIQTGGQRVAPDILFVFDNVPDVVRHEAAHIVTHVAGDGPFASVPSWLDEGTAVYMQRSPGGYEPAVRAAIQGNRTLSLRSMQTAPTRPEDVNLFYGQSWSTAKFMIDEYGRAKFAELYRTIKAGSRIDDALQATYGFNQEGLYNAWRTTNGLQPVATSGPTTGGPAIAEGTRAPLGVPTSSGGSSSNEPASTPGTAGDETVADAGDESGGGSNTTTAVLVLGVTVALAVALGGGGFALLRKRKA
ncbi:MAG: peptidase MA family metallohydrolase [Dehalococcoidia bacterium]